MKAQFLPVGDAMPLEPYAPMAVGQPARRIGHKFNYETGEFDKSDKPYSCDVGSKEHRRCMKMVRRGDLRIVEKKGAK